MSLNTLLVGTRRPSVAFLHGLLGQGRNWMQIAKGLESDVASLLIDLPNHGRSAWTHTFGYAEMADEVADDLQERLGSAASLVVVGHSMGGKVAMALALRRPELVRGLVVVDIAPDDSPSGYGFDRLLGALQELDPSSVESRQDADARLRGSIPDPVVRAFLLQNLRRDRAGFQWQPNLDLLAAHLPEISGWLADISGRYDGPVLWLRGEASDYVRDEHHEPMRDLFPRAVLHTVPGAGHWVHSEAPDAVVAQLRAFLGQVGLLTPPPEAAASPKR